MKKDDRYKVENRKISRFENKNNKERNPNRDFLRMFLKL